VRRAAKAISLSARVVESTSPAFPPGLQKDVLLGCYSQLWALGTLEILKARPLGFFCSAKCPGNVIVQIYDLARALRDARIAVISGFHSSMEKECLELLRRGTAPVVICPARGIERMRLPAAWRTPLDEGRLLVCSPFTTPYRRPTASLAEQRNRLVAALADAVVIAHASPGSKIARLSAEMVASGKRVYTLNLPENGDMIQHGVKGYAVPDLVDCLLRQ